MGYFDSEKNVDGYLTMVEGYDGAALIADFKRHVALGARVLELGMGGGKDLDLLREAGFEVTGSDSSDVFLRRYRERGGTSPALLLDARTIETDLRFDAIYSNKLLHHLTRAGMASSLERQAEVMERDGLLFHSLWAGEGESEEFGPLFTYYTRESVLAIMPKSLEVVELTQYTEMESDDSFWVLLRRRSG